MTNLQKIINIADSRQINLTISACKINPNLLTDDPGIYQIAFTLTSGKFEYLACYETTTPLITEAILSEKLLNHALPYFLCRPRIQRLLELNPNQTNLFE